MKKIISEFIEIPSGVECEHKDKVLICKKGASQTQKIIDIPGVTIKVQDNKLYIEAKYGNKNQLKMIMTSAAHIKNLFRGLEKPFVYKLESANVHFPMTLKVDKNRLVINNFLGEKVPRYANIPAGVEVELKGNQITVSSFNKELAGQTAANFETATKIKKRDRRIFQDGIYITQKSEDIQ